MKIIKQDKPFQPEHADILYGDHYLTRGSLKDLVAERQMVPLGVFYPNTFSALTMLGIDANELTKDVEYECPYTNSNYYWIVPIAILTDDGDALRKQIEENSPNLKRMPWRLDLAFDWSWWQGKDKEFEVDKIAAALLGPGYTSCTMINDGHGSIRYGCIALDNGDHLWVAYHEWYNK